MSEDYYHILGVSENASADEIKKAYRQLSLKYHPDRTDGDSEKTELFQKINNAYETLSDIDKRGEYDMSKQNPFMRMNSMGGGGGMGPNIDINDIFSQLFSGMHGGGMPGMQMHGIPGMQMPGMFGGGPNIRVFRNGMPVNMNQQIEKPQPITKNVNITMLNVLNGIKMPVEIERWYLENGNKIFEVVTIYIDIFKGIDNNEIILLKDQGHSINDTCKGDIKIIITVNNDSNFTRQGLDLIINKEISLKEALCGFSFDIKHINGKVYTINNQPGNIIPPNYPKIISNMGITRDDVIGNLIIHFTTIFPETLSLEKIEELNKIL